MAALSSPAPLQRTWRELLFISLRHRPLLWMAPAIAMGCALGPAFAAFSRATTREAFILLLPLAIGLGCCFCAYCSWRRGRADRARATLFLSLVAICTTWAARRILPPADDLSALVRAPVPMGPQHRVPVQLKGYVADFPDTSDFGVSFPLECVSVATSSTLSIPVTGRVWVDAPLNTDAQVGDAVSLHAELADLPRAGNPGERTPQTQFVAANCWCRAHLQRPAELHLLQRGAGYPLERWIDGLRTRLLHHYEAAFSGSSAHELAQPYPHATAQLLGAMVFGQGGLQEPLPALTRDQFRAAGLSHILVASGTQVSYLLMIVIAVTRAIGFRRWGIIASVLPILLLYALLTGGGPSIWRATIAGLCIAYALLLGRDVDGLSLWCLALSLVLLIDPLQLFSISLQLTFAATWGLIALAPVLTRALEKGSGPTRLNEFASLSLGAQLATLPLLLYHFGRFSAAGIGANFLAVPLAGFLVGTGIAGLWLPFVNALNYPLTRGIASLASFAATTPGAQASTTPFALNWTVVIYAVLLVMAILPGEGSGILRYEFGRWWTRQRQSLMTLRPFGFMTAVVLLTAVIATWRTVTSHPTWLRVTMLDVGQGESILVKAPNGRAVLIDGGSLADEGRGDVGRAIIVPYLQAMGIHKLDAMVITHADADHCNALSSVLSEVPVGLAIDGGAAAQAQAPRLTAHAASATHSHAPHAEGQGAEYEKLKKQLREHNVPIYAARAGQKLNLGDGVTLTVLAPLEPFFPSDNNNAAVLRLDYGTTSMLLTADIEHEAEERLVRRGAPLRCTILKVAHHGSKTSTSLPLLNAAQPQAAILSCGRYNGFGHPSSQTLTRLAQHHVPVYRTDADGGIEVFSDGHACWIQTFR